MQLGSSSTPSPRQYTPILANLVGTAIALLTLILPIVVIAYYSGGEAPLPSPPPQVSPTVSRQ
jgi:hypothetical protein